jgi:anti-sigma regulatory factor (Ser/Thr protein kinase)
MKTLALNILDIVQNSVRAEADDIRISLLEAPDVDLYRITISDNGKGIPSELIGKVTDPFVTTRTRRRMGLGLPLLRQHAELAGGGVSISSEEGKGTEVTALFSFSHIDRQPLGDIAGVVMILFAANPGIEFTYSHKTAHGEYIFSTRETKEVLELSTLSEAGLPGEIRELINENLKEIKASGIENETVYKSVV